MGMAKKPEPPPLPELSPATTSKLVFDNRIHRAGMKDDFHKVKEALRAKLLAAGYSQSVAKERAYLEAWHQFPQFHTDPKDEAKKWIPPKVDVGDKLAKLPALKGRAMRDEAFYWVLNHPAMVREEVGPSCKRYLQAADIDGCPSQGAWLMLLWGVDDWTGFRKEAMTILGKMETAKEKGTAEDSTGDDLGDVTLMLKRMGSDAA